jgi:leucyl aminopeptidase
MSLATVELVSKFPQIDALITFFVSESQFRADTRFHEINSTDTLGYVIASGIPNFPIVYKENSDPLLAIESLGGNAIRKLDSFVRIGVELNGNSAEQSAFLSGLLLAGYKFEKFKSEKASKTQLVFVKNAKTETAERLSELLIVRDSLFLVRDLINTPANHLGPAEFITEATKAARGLPLKIEVFDEKKLAKLGCNAILAVGRGSIRPPALLKISYRPVNAKRHLAFVGKGITFDTGGLSLKPADSMVGMKYDMAGAAITLGSVLALAKSHSDTRITAWMALAENMPGGSATRPNDVITAHNGKTIEILNTDAEGRLVLADALSVASKENPDLIVDVATLTGAATIALGNRHVGVMGDDQAVLEILDAAERARELVWAMPLPEDLSDALKSDVADIANAKIGFRAGGMLLGGIFLKNFIGSTKNGNQSIPWAHLDIAAVGNNAGAPYGVNPKGATGIMLRTLIELGKPNSTRRLK